MNSQEKILRSLRKASKTLALLNENEKTALLYAIANALISQKDEILNANELDLQANKNLNFAMRQRLKLTPASLENLASNTRKIANLPEIINVIQKGYKAPSGIDIARISVPIGVILAIYESRPDVSVQIASLCIKSANACALKGGKEARNTNLAIINAINTAFKEQNIASSVLYLDISRDEITKLLARDDLFDLVVPRGGYELIKSVSEHSKIPVLKHDKGLCHIFVDEKADLDKALKIVLNAKLSHPAACNAVETLLIHSSVADLFLSRFHCEILKSKKDFEFFVCDKTAKIPAFTNAKKADDKAFSTEYNELKLNIKIVTSLNEALEHIERFGSGHSEAIISEDYSACQRFLCAVDAACVYANASTRFSDGGEFGFGGEIGISTNRLHARGPVGLEGLCSYKYIIYGQGQIRE